MKDIEIEIQVKIEKSAPLAAFLKERGVGNIERNYVGYPFLMLFANEVTWETQ